MRNVSIGSTASNLRSSLAPGELDVRRVAGRAGKVPPLPGRRTETPDPASADQINDPRQRLFLAAFEAMNGSLLRYSKRLELLKQARNWGISQFEANLIIAHAQYHAGRLKPPKLISGHAHDLPERPSRSALSLFLRIVVLVVLALLLDLLLIRLIG